MSIQNVSSSTAALNAQLLQQQQQSGDSDFSNASLPQLTSSQVQGLQQALQNDLQQAFTAGTGSSTSGSVQTQLDNSVSNTLSQAGFSQNQIQSILDKINHGFTGTGRGGRGHGAHHARQVINSLIQTLANNGSSASTTTSGSTSSTATTSVLTSAVNDSQSTTAGQSIDVTA
ncbi:MAG TPA: hypothetical protein VG826_10660 [Pirellulales bacterium]|nr:hypothetical protein [Pirellulales bacterium]